MRPLLILVAISISSLAQAPPRPAPPRTGQASAPIDLTGYWVSQIVDEWRFRVTPQKGDIAYLPINAEARKIALTWDPDRDISGGAQCKAYGAVGGYNGRAGCTCRGRTRTRCRSTRTRELRLVFYISTRRQRHRAIQRGKDTR
jgi:hypothetical protein